MFYNLLDGQTVISSEPIEWAEKFDEYTESDMLYIDWVLQKRVDNVSLRNEVEKTILESEKYDKVKTKWIIFDIDSMILRKFFNWDRWAEIWFTQKMVYLQMIERSPDEEKEMQVLLEWYKAKEKFKKFLKDSNEKNSIPQE